MNEVPLKGGGEDTLRVVEAAGIRIAIEGCCHGALDEIYQAVEEVQANNGFTIDLLLICGDFQAIRNSQDLNCMAVPQKYRTMNNYYKYYSGEKEAPVLTIFVGGNHEAANHLWELFHGGWVAKNIYFLGYAGVVNVGGLRIAGLSGIFKENHYKQGHWEHPPYDESSMRSAYHVREYDVWRLMQLSGEVDVMLSHDWPRGVHRFGNEKRLLSRKRFLEQEVNSNTLGNPHTPALMSHLRPSYWFAAHLHTKFAALVPHAVNQQKTKFLSLDKCLPQRDFLQVVAFPDKVRGKSGIRMKYDAEWLAILRATQPFMSVDRRSAPLPPSSTIRGRIDQELEWICAQANADESFLVVPENFVHTLEPHRPGTNLPRVQPPFSINPQTQAFVQRIGVPLPHLRTGVSSGQSGNCDQTFVASAHVSNPDEIDLGDSDDPDSREEAAVANNPDEIDIDDD